MTGAHRVSHYGVGTDSTKSGYAARLDVLKADPKGDAAPLASMIAAR